MVKVTTLALFEHTSTAPCWLLCMSFSLSGCELPLMSACVSCEACTENDTATLPRLQVSFCEICPALHLSHCGIFQSMEKVYRWCVRVYPSCSSWRPGYLPLTSLTVSTVSNIRDSWDRRSIVDARVSSRLCFNNLILAFRILAVSSSFITLVSDLIALQTGGPIISDRQNFTLLISWFNLNPEVWGSQSSWQLLVSLIFYQGENSFACLAVYGLYGCWSKDDISM